MDGVKEGRKRRKAKTAPLILLRLLLSFCFQRRRRRRRVFYCYYYRNQTPSFNATWRLALSLLKLMDVVQRSSGDYATPY